MKKEKDFWLRVWRARRWIRENNLFLRKVAKELEDAMDGK